jgi:hypothetical protein
VDVRHCAVLHVRHDIRFPAEYFGQVVYQPIYAAAHIAPEIGIFGVANKDINIAVRSLHTPTD